MHVVRVKSTICGNTLADQIFDDTIFVAVCNKETIVCENNITIEIWYTDSSRSDT